MTASGTRTPGAHDASLEAHRESIRGLTASGGPLDSGGKHATIARPEWFKNRRPHPERRGLHTRLLDEFRAEQPDVAQGRQAIVMAGPPGAGKSTVLRSVLGDQAAQFLVIDTDDFKERLLKSAIADGTYETHVKPAEVKHREAQGEAFAPLELSGLLHTEAQVLVERARGRALTRGDNIVIDTVLGWEGQAQKLAGELTEAGYDVRVVDVECSYETSAARIEHRWREGYRSYQEDPERAGLGSRWVPDSYAKSLYPPELGGKSKSEGVARTMAEQCPAVSRYELHRVHEPAGSPQLEQAMERSVPGGPLLDPGTARTVTALDSVRGGRAAIRQPPATGRGVGR